MVQGVFFRVETAKVARGLNLVGWVKNRSDEGVEALFEGEKSEVEKAVAFCRRGPTRAKVENVEVQWEDPKDELSDFKIDY
jgi:acylphosphatase